jgi:hypothetical protein
MAEISERPGIVKLLDFLNEEDDDDDEDSQEDGD